MLAFDEARPSLTASITRWGTCVPPGPSKNAARWPLTLVARAGNCERTHSMSSVVMCASRRNAHHAQEERKDQGEKKGKIQKARVKTGRATAKVALHQFASGRPSETRTISISVLPPSFFS